MIDLQKRLDSISPEIKINQFKSIELAINSNKSKINLKGKDQIAAVAKVEKDEEDIESNDIVEDSNEINTN